MGSPPLVRFLRAVGKVQHHLHTVVVGLSAVEKGIATKPDDLDIAWQAHDLVGSAREARRFLLRATLIFVAEELNVFATQVLKYRALATAIDALPEDRAGRIRALTEADEVDPTYLTVAPLVVTHWRNRIVHPDSRARLTPAERQRLLTQSESARDSYKGVDVVRLLGDFETDQPTLKGVTVLLAMSIKFVRHVDSTLPQPATSEHVRLWLQAENLLTEVLRIEKEAANGGDPDPRRRGKQYLLTKAPGLAQVYYANGSGVPVSKS
jgi:hypothetical protein